MTAAAAAAAVFMQRVALDGCRRRPSRGHRHPDPCSCSPPPSVPGDLCVYAKCKYWTCGNFVSARKRSNFNTLAPVCLRMAAACIAGREYSSRQEYRGAILRFRRIRVPRARDFCGQSSCTVVTVVVPTPVHFYAHIVDINQHWISDLQYSWSKKEKKKNKKRFELRKTPRYMFKTATASFE